MDAIEFEGQLTLPVMRRALLLVGKPGPILRWTFTALAAPFILMSLVVVFRDPGDSSLLVAPVILGGLTLFIWFSPTFAARSNLRNNRGQFPLGGRITDDGVELRDQYSSSNFPFSIFRRFKASKTLVVLVHENGGINLFPREFFHSDRDFETFKHVVAQKVRPSRDIRSFLMFALWFVVFLIVVMAYVVWGR